MFGKKENINKLKSEPLTTTSGPETEITSDDDSVIDTQKVRKPVSLEDLPDLHRTLEELTNHVKTISMSIRQMNNSLQVLDSENRKRTEEIKALRQIVLLNYDSTFETNNPRDRKPSHIPTAPYSLYPNLDRMNHDNIDIPPLRRHESPSPSQSSQKTTQMKTPENLLRIIEPLQGRDDLGVEDFIHQVEFARARCEDQEMLLFMVLSEKILGNAKRNIRYIPIKTFKELYSALRQTINSGMSITSNRDRLRNTRQQINENITEYNSRFRRAFHELRYAVQNKHTNLMERHVALETEEENATSIYISNIKPEISNILMAKNMRNLAEIQSYAIDIEAKIRERDIYQKTTNPRPLPASNNNRPLLRNNIFRSENKPNPSNIKRCTKCQKLGHTRETCYVNFPRNQFPTIPPQVNHILPEVTEITKTIETQDPYDYTMQQENYDTLPYVDAINQYDSFSTQEQEYLSLNDPPYSTPDNINEN